MSTSPLGRQAHRGRRDLTALTRTARTQRLGAPDVKGGHHRQTNATQSNPRRGADVAVSRLDTVLDDGQGG